MSRAETATVIARGGLHARLAAGAGDLARVLALRDQAFPALAGADDPFDSQAEQLMIEGAEGQLLLALRLCILDSAADWGRCYSAAFYDLHRLSQLPGGALEIGRLCLLPGAARGWEALRLAWAALLRIGEAAGAVRIFGCTSFSGTDPAAFLPGFAALIPALAPQSHQPGRIAPEVIAWPALSAASRPDPSYLPPLLRFYTSLGGQVSDHAVIDRELQTLHVFTCVEAAQMPQARIRALRASAAG